MSYLHSLLYTPELFRKSIEMYSSNGESKKVVAEKMGIGIATLYRKLKKYNIKL